MEDALRNIDRALKERRRSSKIDILLPSLETEQKVAAEGLGIEHYGKVSMVVEGKGQIEEAARVEASARQTGPRTYQDAASRIAAGSKELSLDELSAPIIPGELLKGSQLGGSRFHEISLDELSSPPPEDNTTG